MRKVLFFFPVSSLYKEENHYNHRKKSSLGKSVSGNHLVHISQLYPIKSKESFLLLQSLHTVMVFTEKSIPNISLQNDHVWSQAIDNLQCLSCLMFLSGGLMYSLI